ncbi:ABC transporter substrate-binding protein [Jatrophihabitans endophyticus]|uniref:ABC transporter substrate-binding protein n=1 Tax=Jatrophihabitans endophyticus TaxID=1206085 RepID=UPI0019E7CA1D|nr:ABC transporter substrate-binding protein [Jatrophihabitans endophyticus]MBE7187086.1 ABC transporter substrate-binding protein [Jatrophihabitans endophyticus]
MSSTPILPDVSRRTVLAGLGLGGAAVAAGLAGCSAAVNQNTSAGGGGRPTHGGTLQAAITQDLIPANMFTNTTSAVTAMIGLVYESLIRYPNDSLDPQPRLATSWKLSPDGRMLTMNLRKGVTFHTGRPFTSEDVEFSVRTYASDKWNGQEKSTAQVISSVDTSDPHVAVLHLSHTLSNIYDVLDTIYIVDRETFADFEKGKNFVGTGPFKFVSWTPNASLVYTRNEHYWQKGLPYLDGVHISIVPDATSVTSQLRSGQIDFAEGVSYLDAKNFSTTSGFSTLTLTGAEQQIYVGANVTAKPLDDLRVRQAIAYAIDRDRIVNEVFSGAGYPVALPWPKYSPAYDEARNRQFAYNPAKAKALVKQVGSIPTIPYTYNTALSSYGDTAQVVQSNLSDVGIKVELDPVDSAQFTKQLIGAEFKGLWTTFHSWAQYVPSTLTVSAYPFNASHNASHYLSKRYSSDATSAWEQQGPTSSAAVTDYGKLSDDLLSSLFLIEIGVIPFRWVHSSKLSGISYTKRWELDLTKAHLA